jgi:hypothetical protein
MQHASQTLCESLLTEGIVCGDCAQGIPLNPWQGHSPSGNSTGPTDGPPVPAEEVQAVLAKLVAVRTSSAHR